MKNFKYLLFLCLSAGLFFGCEYDAFEEESGLAGVVGTEQNPFVRLDNSLQGAAGVGEADGSLSITVENLFQVETNIVVSYTLGGTATFGVDYDIAGADASGGTVTLEFDPDALGITDNTIDITILDDMDVEGAETIVLTLTEAKADNNKPFNVGQGDLHKDVTITISDDDE